MERTKHTQGNASRIKPPNLFSGAKRTSFGYMCFNPDYKVEISWYVAEDNLLKLDGFQQCPEYNVKKYRESKYAQCCPFYIEKTNVHQLNSG